MDVIYFVDTDNYNSSQQDRKLIFFLFWKNTGITEGSDRAFIQDLLPWSDKLSPECYSIR